MSTIDRPKDEDQGDSIDISTVLRFLRRRRAVIISVTILITALVALIVHQLTPQYRAQAVLMIDSRQANVTNVEAVLSGLSTESAAITSELDILRSPPLMQRVVDRLNLYDHPLFNQAPKPSAWASVREWVTGLLPEAFAERDAQEVIEEVPDPEAERRRLARRLLGGLETENSGRSYTIRVSYTSPDPQLSMQVANTVADQYLVDQLEAKFEATRRANSWLQERLEELREEVRVAELAVREYRETHNLVENHGVTVNEQQLAEINAQLVVAQVERSQAESRLQAARSGSPEGLRDVEGATLLRDLRAEISSLRRREAEMSTRYGDRHPEMINIRAERQDIQARIQEETGRVIQTLINEVEVARAKERALQEALGDLRGATAGAQRAGVELAELERQAEAARLLYENFLGRYRETSEQQELDRPDARIIAEAELPSQPSFPRKGLMMAGGGVLGLLLGLGAAVLLELLDRGFRRSEQLEKATATPILGVAPLIKVKSSPTEYLLNKPFSAFSESLRTIRTALQFTNVDNPHKVVLITSSVPGEGKSTLSFGLARMAAQAGARTLFIEADLRRPIVAKQAGLKPSAYLSDVLIDEARLEEALTVDERSGAHLILAKGGVPSPAELLASRKMAALLQSMKAHYDLILVDTPPVMAVSDAAVLGQAVDAVLFVVRWAETPRETVKAALHQLSTLGVEVTGLVMSQVDLRKQASYGYGDYGYYYGRYKEYYAE